MTVRVRMIVKSQKVTELLKGDELETLLAAKAEAVAAAAEIAADGIRIEGVPGRKSVPITSTVTRGSKRSRAVVTIDHPAGVAVEAKHAILAGAIDAARNVP